MFENVDGSIQVNVFIFQVAHVFPGKITLEWKNKNPVLLPDDISVLSQKV